MKDKIYMDGSEILSLCKKPKLKCTGSRNSNKPSTHKVQIKTEKTKNRFIE